MATSLPHQLSLCVTPLRRLGCEDVEGTGFLYYCDGKTFLVTCYHVFAMTSSASEEWTAVLHVRGSGAQGLDVSKTGMQRLPFRVPENVLFCPTADLAVVELPLPPPSSAVIFRTIDRSRLAMEDTDFWPTIMQIGAPVMMAGYPGGVVDPYHNLPVFRFGHIAFEPRLDWADEPLGLISMALYNADSGAPVFWQGQKSELKVSAGGQGHLLQVSAELKLVGVHCGGFSHRARGVREEATGSPIAIGVFIKAAVLADGFASWPSMEQLRGSGFVHPRPSKSSHHLRASGQAVPLGEDRCPALVTQATELDEEVRDRVGAVDADLVEKLVGRKWCFAFDEAHVLQRLTVGARTYTRCNSTEFGGEITEPCLRFAAPVAGSDTLFDGVFVFCTYPRGSRQDGVAVSGVTCHGLERNEELPFAGAHIAWIQKDPPS